MIQWIQLGPKKLNLFLNLVLSAHNQPWKNPDGIASGFLRKHSSFLIRNFTKSDLLSWQWSHKKFQESLMCSSRCLKDTCSLMALVWSLIDSCGVLWVFIIVVGILVGSFGSYRLLTWMGSDGDSNGLKYVFNGILWGFWSGSYEVSLECPSDIAFGIFLFWFLSLAVCGSGVL